MPHSSSTLAYVCQMLTELAQLLESAGYSRFAVQLRVVEAQIARHRKAH